MKKIPLRQFIQRRFNLILWVTIGMITCFILPAVWEMYSQICAKEKQLIDLSITDFFKSVDDMLLQTEEVFNSRLEEELFHFKTEYKELQKNSSIHEGIGRILKNLRSVQSRTLPVEDINYYFISPQGVVYETDYATDIGLDLSQYKEFWKTLKPLRPGEIMVQPIDSESLTGRLRLYGYLRLPNESTFEIGIAFGDMMNAFKQKHREWGGRNRNFSLCLYSQDFVPMINAGARISSLETALLKKSQKTGTIIERSESFFKRHYYIGWSSKFGQRYAKITVQQPGKVRLLFILTIFLSVLPAVILFMRYRFTKTLSEIVEPIIRIADDMAFFSQTRESRLKTEEIGITEIDHIVAVYEDLASVIPMADQALRESEERLNLALEGTNDGMWDFHPVSGHIYLSPRWFTMLGYAPNAFPHHFDTWAALLHPEDKDEAIKKLKAFLDSRQIHYRLVFRMRAQNGDWRWILSRGKTVQRGLKGEIIRMVGTHTDITLQKHAEEETQRLRNYLQNIINSMPSVIVAADPDANAVLWNTEAEKQSHLSAEEAAGSPLSSLFPQLNSVMGRIFNAIRNQEACSIEKVIFPGNGRNRFMNITVYPLLEEGGAVMRMDDVTEQIHMEDIMIQTEKMMTVGGLAAGMAHEINNPLAGILQSIQVVQNRISTRLPKNKKTAEECGVQLENIIQYLEKRGIFSMVEAIAESGERASGIVRNMLSFSRKSDAEFSPHDLSSLMDLAVELASNDYDLKKKYDFRNICIIRRYEPGIPPVRCEGNELMQVLLNLLKNGAQAMSENQQSFKPPQFILHIFQKNGAAFIEMTDNGPGMDEKTCSRIFTPFYTTKTAGTGTGLGLSVSRYIIHEKHGGQLTVKSVPHQGTAFTIRLPLIPDEDAYPPMPDAEGAA